MLMAALSMSCVLWGGDSPFEGLRCSMALSVLHISESIAAPLLSRLLTKPASWTTGEGMTLLRTRVL